MMDQVKAPDYCLKNTGCTTQREWRRYKRADLKAMRQAFDQLRRGCVYTPNSDGAIGKMDDLLQQLERLWSPKEWGR